MIFKATYTLENALLLEQYKELCAVLCLKICGVYNFLQYLVFQYHLMAVNMDRKPRECLCVPDINYSCPTVKFLACLTNPF